MESIESLVARLTEYRNAYYNGTPLVSDLDYDEAEATLRERDPNNAFFSNVGAPVLSDKKRKHKIPMGSLNKIKLEDDGVNTLIKNYLSKGDMICSYKMDGISFSVDYKDGVFQSATTRGDGIVGEIINDATTMGNVHNTLEYLSYGKIHKLTGTLRGELIIEWEDFELINSKLSNDEKFSNPRNATAGIVRKENSPYKHYVKAYYYNMIRDGFEYSSKYNMLCALQNIVSNDAVVKYESFTWDCYPAVLEEYIDRMDKTRKELPYMIDGLVFEFDDQEFYHSLGESCACPKGAVALKLTAKAETTHMTDIVWSPGSTGTLCPVAQFTPTLVDGSIVSRASIHNYDIFKRWNLGVGDEIEIQKNNDIIPQIKRVVKHVGDKFVAPTNCHECGSELVFETINTTELKCPNLNCKCRSLGNIMKLIDKMGMNTKGVGEAFAEAYITKYDNVWSIFDLSEVDIKQLSDRYKDKSAKKIYDAIQSSKGCKLADFFGALNIEGCGSRTFKRIIDYLDIQTIKGVVDFVNCLYIRDVSGIGESTVDALQDGMDAKSKIIDNLAERITIIQEDVQVVSDLGSFLFTGTFSVKRSELEKMVIAKGGIVGSSVNKDLTYLVQSDPTSTSAKSEKAKKLGVKIIDENEFVLLINKNELQV